ncbi:MAG: hypothetical protein JNJ78_18575 [Anaerolineae bacterium]|nr:hypothetical protein [Anaerolineae bacterium]
MQRLVRLPGSAKRLRATLASVGVFPPHFTATPPPPPPPTLRTQASRLCPSPIGSIKPLRVKFRACLRQSRPFPPPFLSATTTTTTTKAPLGGSIGAFPPFYSAAPPPLLLQNPSGMGLAFASLGNSY